MIYRNPRAAKKVRLSTKKAQPKPAKVLRKAKKRETVSSYKKKADAAFSIYIRYRTARFERGQWQVACCTCGVEKPVREMQNGHFVSRKVTHLRYDERNCNPQCPSCNVFNHGELFLYGLFLDRTYGEGTAAELMAERFYTHKLTIPELMDIIETSRERVLAIDPEAFKGRTKAGRLSTTINLHPEE